MLQEAQNGDPLRRAAELGPLGECGLPTQKRQKSGRPFWILQADTIIDRSKKWFNSNELFLNIEKTEICSFSLKRSQNSQFTIHVKFLGIDLDSSLSWSLHVETLCSRLSKDVYAIKKVSQTVDTEAAVTAYNGLFHSSLNYEMYPSVNYKKFLLYKKLLFRV
nr:unnamed protein product [Callosobruchus chinensis]